MSIAVAGQYHSICTAGAQWKS